MRQLLPHPTDDVDPLPTYAVDRPRPAGRPWVASLFASSADGAAAVGGRSGPLGGAGDLQVFRAVRAVADVVVAGAGTVRTERYGPVRAVEAAADARAARGQARHPRLVVVTRSLALDPDQRLFTEADGTTEAPLVVHPPGAPLAARRRLQGVAELVEVGAGPDGGVAPAALLGELDRRGVDVAVCEGGPTLNGGLVADDLVDEVCLTLDPMVVGGDAPRIAPMDGVPAAPRAWHGAFLLEHDGVLFWRLLRDRSRP
ncbi:dihydrofolate reductase family protein [Iamia majanohamensis]|uniref:Dihydrofolate reductase family protein n=1 Tax=Iamia majanohamensis TaxID=467976 RepID=A0AAE9Y6M9_9ACTN|nr:dihydrofolate reductase family protein [Iamia majanohamensis]WCO65343.1 dihydrofolate reductase family protein [Iamia majanohamensis]